MEESEKALESLERMLETIRPYLPKPQKPIPIENKPWKTNEVTYPVKRNIYESL
jgi:hypothetical protein